MSFYNLTPSSTSSLDSFESSASSTPEAILAMYPLSDFSLPPSGAALPLPGPRRVRSGSFSEQRGHNFSIQIDSSKPIGEVAVAKGHLEPRAGTLPRRPRRKAQPQVMLAPAEIQESKSFDLFVEAESNSNAGE
ncbi:hypothetical protein E1B28_010425 [Marasmius oreades]|uniref:Uncharacterized protein n=1 Tax=Marasmius oreades TaxID=181124 RepID=A0A9P7RXS4_9AGAR|nr:uncharacterized protein E1B28_010425 [Marasmius oreades]KAG7091387.1 hypothetical protein E1B28_010425 [Marasmius oreades]